MIFPFVGLCVVFVVFFIARGDLSGAILFLGFALMIFSGEYQKGGFTE